MAVKYIAKGGETHIWVRTARAGGGAAWVQSLCNQAWTRAEVAIRSRKHQPRGLCDHCERLRLSGNSAPSPMGGGALPVPRSESAWGLLREWYGVR